MPAMKADSRSSSDGTEWSGGAHRLPHRVSNTWRP